MVIPNPDESSHCKGCVGPVPNNFAEHKPNQKLHVVQVPVMLSVTLPADDSLQAEVVAIDKVAGLEILLPPALGFQVKVVGIIAPRPISKNS